MSILKADTLAALLAWPYQPSQKHKDRAAQWIDPINSAMDSYKINTAQRVSAFISQVLHESARLVRVTENLNYSAPALMSVWPRRFTSLDMARQYERNPEKIANFVYGGRMGNTSPADGWRYRGRGPLQITGKENYGKCGMSIGQDLISKPELLEVPKIGALSAGWFWSVNNLNELADIGDIAGLTKKINGGTHGLAERIDLYDAARKMLGVV